MNLPVNPCSVLIDLGSRTRLDLLPLANMLRTLKHCALTDPMPVGSPRMNKLSGSLLEHSPIVVLTKLHTARGPWQQWTILNGPLGLNRWPAWSNVRTTSLQLTTPLRHSAPIYPELNLASTRLMITSKLSRRSWPVVTLLHGSPRDSCDETLPPTVVYAGTTNLPLNVLPQLATTLASVLLPLAVFLPPLTPGLNNVAIRNPGVRRPNKRQQPIVLGTESAVSTVRNPFVRSSIGNRLRTLEIITPGRGELTLHRLCLRKLLTLSRWPLVLLITGFTGILDPLTQRRNIPVPTGLVSVLLASLVPVPLRVMVCSILELPHAAITHGLNLSIPRL